MKLKKQIKKEIKLKFKNYLNINLMYKCNFNIY